jgi:phosphoglycerate dehydrogenase-like enzyme
VPQVLAPVLAALGCRVIYTARTVRDVPYEYRDLNGLLAEADVVSLHVPQTAETVGLIDAAALGRMKPGAVLVNTARGGLVDEAALVAALRSGRVAAAGLDVFAQEPVAADNPLLSLENVVVAPHVAWVTTGTFARAFEVAAENVRRLAAGAELLHRVA